LIKELYKILDNVDRKVLPNLFKDEEVRPYTLEEKDQFRRIMLGKKKGYNE